MNNALVSFQQPVPAWQVLQFQRGQQVRLVPVPVMVVQQPAQMAEPGSPVPALLTIGSALVFALSDNKAVKALALQAFSVGATAWVGQSLN